MPKTSLRPALLVLGFFASLAVSACNGDEDEKSDGCPTGEVDCECNGGECPGDLVCVSGRCREPAGDSSMDGETTADTGESAGDTTADTGESAGDTTTG